MVLLSLWPGLAQFRGLPAAESISSFELRITWHMLGPGGTGSRTRQEHRSITVMTTVTTGLKDSEEISVHIPVPFNVYNSTRLKRRGALKTSSLLERLGTFSVLP